jgi:hypothetical protein
MRAAAPVGTSGNGNDVSSRAAMVVNHAGFAAIIGALSARAKSASGKRVGVSVTIHTSAATFNMTSACNSPSVLDG